MTGVSTSATVAVGVAAACVATIEVGDVRGVAWAGVTTGDVTTGDVTDRCAPAGGATDRGVTTGDGVESTAEATVVAAVLLAVVVLLVVVLVVVAARPGAADEVRSVVAPVAEGAGIDAVRRRTAASSAPVPAGTTRDPLRATGRTASAFAVVAAVAAASWRVVVATELRRSSTERAAGATVNPLVGEADAAVDGPTASPLWSWASLDAG
jgi:hypothetical protein